MKLNRTTQRTVEILKLVSKNPDGITLDEICDKLQLPKTSGYDIVTTLAEMGMVNVARGQKQRYTIGLTAYRIGINYTNNLDFIGIIEPELKAFAREVGKTVFFGDVYKRQTWACKLGYQHAGDDGDAWGDQNVDAGFF